MELAQTKTKFSIKLGALNSNKLLLSTNKLKKTTGSSPNLVLAWLIKVIKKSDGIGSDQDKNFQSN